MSISRSRAGRALKIGGGQVSRLSALLHFFRDPSASLPGKLFVVLAMAYVVMPLDFIPDVMPFIGWLDDLGVMGLAMAYMLRVASRYREPVPVPVRR